jgi:hypothetical protein
MHQRPPQGSLRGPLACRQPCPTLSGLPYPKQATFHAEPVIMDGCPKSAMTSSRPCGGCEPPSAPSRSSRSFAITQSLAMTQRMVRVEAQGSLARGAWPGGEDGGPKADDP